MPSTIKALCLEGSEDLKLKQILEIQARIRERREKARREAPLENLLEQSLSPQCDRLEESAQSARLEEQESAQMLRLNPSGDCHRKWLCDCDRHVIAEY